MDELNANPLGGAESEIPADDAEARFASLIGGEPGQEQASIDKGARQGQPVGDANGEPQERTYVVKVDGQEVEVTESELLNGYSRDADYRNKTKALADERRQMQEWAQGVQAERAQYAQAIQHYLTSTPQPTPPDPGLIDSDPVEYLKQQRAFETAIAERQYAQQQMSWAQQQYEMEQHQAIAAYRADQQQALLAAIPEWADTKAASEGKAELREYLAKEGYTNEAISSLMDAKVVLTARKAMLYDKAVAQAQTSAKKLENLPRFERPGTRQVSATDGRTQAMQTLKRSGGTDAAAAVFERLL